MALEAAEQIANMMVMDPYPGFEGQRLLLPLPQRGAQAGAEAASADVDGLHQPRHHQGRRLATASARWPSPSSTRRRRAPGPRSTTASSSPRSACRIGHAVNANIAMVSNFSVHHDRDEAIRRGQEGFEFFGYAVNALVAHDAVPGRSQPVRGLPEGPRAAATRRSSPPRKARERNANGIGTPDDIRDHIRAFQDAGVDQVIFLQQAGRNKHEHICESLELFAAEVMPRVQGRRPPSARRRRPRSSRPTSRPPWRGSAGCRRWPTTRSRWSRRPSSARRSTWRRAKAVVQWL